MKDFREQNYYELLEVSEHASQQEIESGYERVKRIFGSRSLVTYALFTPEELVTLRRRIEDAFKVLSDPERRLLYDQELQRLEGEGWRPAFSNRDAKEAGAPEGHAADADSGTLPLELPLAPRSGPGTEPPPGEQTPQQHPPQPPSPAAAGGAEAAPAQVKQQPEKLVDQAGKESPLELGPDTEITGELLARARRRRGLTLEKIADTTKISIYYLRNLEKEDFDNLPARVYVRGYLKQVAALLGLDPNLVVAGYLRRMDAGD